MGRTQVTDIPGICPHTAQVLARNGIQTLEDLASLSPEELVSIPGFGPARAAAIGQAISRLQRPLPAVDTSTDKLKKKDKKKKQKKGGKKKKKKDKKKDKGKGKKKDKKGKGKKRK